MLKISVVIPTWNRADLLARTIDKIEQQTFAREFYEVLVVDNGSSDHTQNLLEQKSRPKVWCSILSIVRASRSARFHVGITTLTLSTQRP